MIPHQKQAAIFADRLLSWWKQNKQSFPWRSSSDPYQILIAEILLRKTTAKQVAKIYKNFLRLFPSPKSLAEADVENLEEALKPLGMYRVRAKLLKKIGEILDQRFAGKVPDTKDGLLLLPGVKEYVANAVLCFAYNKDVPLVDTNAVRIFQRVFGFKSEKKRVKDDPAIWKFAEAVTPPGRAKDFNLALIDFAHKVCRPKTPDCRSCTMRDVCISYSEKRSKV